MDQRKLIQHGLSSLTLTIPSDWLKKRNLKKGDKLYIQENENSIIIQSVKPKFLSKTKINADDFDRTSLTLGIQQAYRLGFMEIEISHSKKFCIHLRKNKEIQVSQVIQEITQRLIGFEIIEKNPKNTIIKQLTLENKKDLNMLSRRIFLLLQEISKLVIRLIEIDDIEILEIENLHRNINNLSNYNLRLLSLFGFSDSKQTHLNYFIISSIEKIVDIIKYNSRFISENKCSISKESIKILKNIHNSIEIYYELYFKKQQGLIIQFSKNRNDIKILFENNLFNFSKDEIYILSSQKQIIELLQDLIYFK